jgi:hypothetical protein
MNNQTSVETCRWAKPTVRAPYQPRPLDDPSVCHGCPRWEPHRVHVDELPAR